MQKLIGKNMFEQSLFAQCECGKEIIEFGEDEGEYFICYHSWYDRKLDRYSDFTFADKGELAELVGKIRDFLRDVPDNTPLILIDKYLSYKNKLPGALTVDYDDYCVSIRKYARYDKRKKSTWEILFKKEEAEQIVNELDNWR